MPWDPQSYDDEEELTAYVWDNYAHLQTVEERRAALALFAEEKSRSASDRMRKALEERFGNPNDPELAELLKDGPAEFRKRVRQRILSERADEVLINRCEKCHRVVATPKAQQCLWCGHDWHGPKSPAPADRFPTPRERG